MIMKGKQANLVKKGFFLKKYRKNTRKPLPVKLFLYSGFS